jgi:hypothetical protein
MVLSSGEASSTSGTTVTCPSCGSAVHEGDFCGACGAHLTSAGPTGPRHHAFAANPAEHVFHLSAISTLLPHLPHRGTLPFRLALLIGSVVLIVLGLLRLTGPSIAFAAALIPLLYLTYLYEVQVYADEPWRVVGATLVLGLLLGLPWAYVTGPIVTHTLILATNDVASPERILLTGVLFPLVAQLLMLIGPLILRYTRHFTEALDGFTFAAASALGFTFATTIVELWPQLQAGPVSSLPVTTTVLAVIQRGLLIPIINASTTGLIGAAIWTRRGTLATGGAPWVTSRGLAIAVAMAAQVSLGLVSSLVVSPIYAVAGFGLVAVVLLFWVRIALHHMLLAEAAEVSPGPDMVCSHCHRIVPRMAFCPHCGVATRSTPKSERLRPIDTSHVDSRTPASPGTG